MFTIDTSVFVADLTPSETGHADSRALLDRLRADGTPLVLPTLLLVELAGALSRIYGDPMRAQFVMANLSGNPQATFVTLDQALACAPPISPPLTGFVARTRYMSLWQSRQAARW